MGWDRLVGAVLGATIILAVLVFGTMIGIDSWGDRIVLTPIEVPKELEEKHLTSGTMTQMLAASLSATAQRAHRNIEEYFPNFPAHREIEDFADRFAQISIGGSTYEGIVGFVRRQLRRPETVIYVGATPCATSTGPGFSLSVTIRRMEGQGPTENRRTQTDCGSIMYAVSMASYLIWVKVEPTAVGLANLRSTTETDRTVATWYNAMALRDGEPGNQTLAVLLEGFVKLAESEAAAAEMASADQQVARVHWSSAIEASKGALAVFGQAGEFRKGIAEAEFGQARALHQLSLLVPEPENQTRLHASLDHFRAAIAKSYRPAYNQFAYAMLINAPRIFKHGPSYNLFSLPPADLKDVASKLEEATKSDKAKRRAEDWQSHFLWGAALGGLKMYPEASARLEYAMLLAPHEGLIPSLWGSLLAIAGHEAVGNNQWEKAALLFERAASRYELAAFWFDQATATKENAQADAGQRDTAREQQKSYEDRARGARDRAKAANQSAANARELLAADNLRGQRVPETCLQIARAKGLYVQLGETSPADRLDGVSRGLNCTGTDRPTAMRLKELAIELAAVTPAPTIDWHASLDFGDWRPTP